MKIIGRKKNVMKKKKTFFLYYLNWIHTVGQNRYYHRLIWDPVLHETGSPCEDSNLLPSVEVVHFYILMEQSGEQKQCFAKGFMWVLHLGYQWMNYGSSSARIAFFLSPSHWMFCMKYTIISNFLEIELFRTE